MASNRRSFIFLIFYICCIKKCLQKKIYNLSYSVYEHGTTDIADLSCMYARRLPHMNFVMSLVVVHRSVETKGLMVDSSQEPRIYLCPSLPTRQKYIYYAISLLSSKSNISLNLCSKVFISPKMRYLPLLHNLFIFQLIAYFNLNVVKPLVVRNVRGNT